MQDERAPVYGRADEFAKKKKRNHAKGTCPSVPGPGQPSKRGIEGQEKKFSEQKLPWDVQP